MKSALEIAMERANKISGGEENVVLTDDQKKEIANLRKEYKGKIAEREIMLEGDIKKIFASVSPEEAHQLIEVKKQELVARRKEFNKELEEKVQQIRDKK